MRERPVLVYDGDCAFCTSSIRWAQRHIPMRAEPVAFQFADLAALGTTEEQAAHEIVWVSRTGRTYGGAQAVARLLMDAGGAWRILGAIGTLPPISRLLHGVYRLVAGNRHRLPGGTAACALPPHLRPGA